MKTPLVVAMLVATASAAPSRPDPFATPLGAPPDRGRPTGCIAWM